MVAKSASLASWGTQEAMQTVFYQGWEFMSMIGVGTTVAKSGWTASRKGDARLWLLLKSSSTRGLVEMMWSVRAGEATECCGEGIAINDVICWGTEHKRAWEFMWKTGIAEEDVVGKEGTPSELCLCCAWAFTHSNPPKGAQVSASENRVS